MSDVAALVRALQERLLASAEEYLLFGDAAIDARVRDAFFAVPRHRFIPRYRDLDRKTWNEVNEDNLLEHLPTLYREPGLAIGVDNRGDAVTISGVGWVLYALGLLQVQPGHRVFEVGAGSGFNAALLGQLAGPHGHVRSVEIIPELAAQAARAVAGCGGGNVDVLCADAGADLHGEARYDRVVFTAGAHDIPSWMHERVRVGGLLLMALKLPGGGDLLTLFRREADHFVSRSARACEVVWMRGVNEDRALDPVVLERWAPFARFRERLTARRPFVFGGRSRAGFVQRTAAVRSYLAIREPRMRWFVAEDGWPYYSFGLHDAASDSFVLARDGELRSYGGGDATDALVTCLHEWVDRGMPSAETMTVRAYRSGTAPAPSSEEVIVSRAATDFLWSTD